MALVIGHCTLSDHPSLPLPPVIFQSMPIKSPTQSHWTAPKRRILHCVANTPLLISHVCCNLHSVTANTYAMFATKSTHSLPFNIALHAWILLRPICLYLENICNFTNQLKSQNRLSVGYLINDKTALIIGNPNSELMTVGFLCVECKGTV